MASLIDAVGECLVCLGDGNYDASLAVVDGYLGKAEVAEGSDSEPEHEPHAAGFHPLGVSIERRAALRNDDSCSESSSFSDVASFRDASSSPFWQETADFSFHAARNEHESGTAAGRVHNHTAESVLGSLRQLVERERAWAEEKANYETYLAQMALQLEQQAQVLQDSAEPLPATVTEPAVVIPASASSPLTAVPVPASDDASRSVESNNEPAVQATSN
ncbi:hypothetical protein IWW38_004478, partial [Coemansia aciculifera]